MVKGELAELKVTPEARRKDVRVAVAAAQR